MTEINPDVHAGESKLPLQLEAARVVGQIPTSAFPWLESRDPSQPLNVSELSFVDGTAYLVSAVPPKLQEIAQIARSQDPRLEEGEHYTRSDMIMIMAAHLEASGQAMQSQRINFFKGDIDPRFAHMPLFSYKEAPKANTRRLYYGKTELGANGFQQTEWGGGQIDPTSPLIVRLALTDKKHQVATLRELTTHSTATLKSWGLGDI